MSATEVLSKSIVVFNKNIEKSVENNDISKSVKRLLSSLQSVSKRQSISDKSILLSTDESFREEMIKCLSKLEDIVLTEESFAETAVLSGLAIAFALNVCLCDDIRKAISIYFKLFRKQSIVCIDFNDYKTDSKLIQVLDSSQTNSSLTEVSLLSGLLNCSYFIDYLIQFEPKVFVLIHSHIVRICSQRLIHQFHVFRLLQHWFRTFKTYIKELAEKEPNLLNDRSVITSTLEQIDNNWEHPINGVKDCIKIIYNLVLDTFTTFKKLKPNNLIDSYDLIGQEVVKTSQLAPTCKAKYRKFSALVGLVGWKCLLERDATLSSQMFKYISINSLSTAIIELYKSIVISMTTTCISNEDLLTNWLQHWLTPICTCLKSKNKVIHNNMTAHILPFTLKHIHNSNELIFENINDSSVAEVALVRAAIDTNLLTDCLPPFSWLQKVLVLSEDIAREEAISLLIDEKYINDRNKVLQLFQLFVLSNLNVDNPSFRQKMVSKVDHFITKLCISLSDKFGLHGVHDQSDLNTIEFLSQYTRIITSNLISGASFQRRTTSLLLLHSLIAIEEKHNLRFDKSLDLNSIYFLIILSVIDKDDKVRKIASNLLIAFHKNYFNSIDFRFDQISEIALNLLNSAKHQESHSGGLLMKYIINRFNPFEINGKIVSNELQLIELFVNSAQNQFKDSKINFLQSAKTGPIHGFLLALNNCLSYDCLQKFVNENEFKVLINNLIDLCFDCIELMLSQLSNDINIETSPSFEEMCKSLETIITDQMSGEQSFDDISTSNDFQLLLSMCWLNIKECTFLLSNCIELCQLSECQLISDSKVKTIGSQIVNVLTKCRHKGVIDATCIALTRYTVSLIKLKTRNNEYIQTLKQLLTDSLNCITKSALTSSITRRSAGVALTVQAVLIGESEAYNEGYKLDVSLFSQTIDELISIANSELPKNIDLKSDLPQTYALHILKSIVGTASLSRFTVKCVEFLLPICIKHFSSNVWQIRNASLQLFGSACCRMLGQRKISDIDHMMSEGSTITSEELFCRYPTLLSSIKLQFEESFKRMENGFMCSELVPVLALFASFSPIYLGQRYEDKQIMNYLIRLLSNKIWKIRMLSAKALSVLLPINQLEDLLFQLSDQQNLNCNSIHGLMLSVNHLLELKQQIKSCDYKTTKDRFSLIFEKLIHSNLKCYILSDVYREIFENKVLEIDCCGQELDDMNTNENNPLNDNFIEFLAQIESNVEFTKSDDIRLFAAKDLNNKIPVLLEAFELTHSSDIVFKIVEILLVVLEDEDRNIRSEAEIIASKLIDLNQNMSFNVAIDNLMIWLIENPLIDSRKLTNFLFSKLESVLSLHELFELQKQNEILFEKEEKNVFAEPLFQLFRISECLLKVISNRKTTIEEKCVKKLVNDCRQCLQHKSLFQLKTLVEFSIWKLPKLFVCLSSLYLRLNIFFHSMSRPSTETQMSAIIESLNELQLSSKELDKCFEQILSEEEIVIITQTFRLLSTELPFLLVIKQNTLSGHSIVKFSL